MADYLRVLSIDGGGIRGLIPAMVLTQVEEMAGRPTAQLFDVIAGTSTGGILALALTVPGPAGPRWTAAELVDLYETEGPSIFSRDLRHATRSAAGLRRAKYSPATLDHVLDDYLGKTMLSHALCDVMVPAYDIEQRNRYWFKSRNARLQPTDDALMRDVGRATSAAPTYFEPAWVSRAHRSRALIDGGMFANNPAMAAYAEANDPTRYERKPTLILSLGTGHLTQALPYERVRRWGLARWARPALDVVFDGVSSETHHSLLKLMPASDYLRLQPELTSAKDAMDATGKRNIRMLKAQGEKIAFQNRAALRAVIDRLTVD